MENRSFSRYRNIKSIIHNIDPITKFAAFILLTTIVFLASGYIQITIVFSFVLFVSLLSKTRVKTYFITLLMLVPFYLMMLPFYWFATSDIKVALNLVSMIAYRVYIFILISIIFTSTTKETEIASAIEWYITPLRLVKIPTYEIAMIITLAIRFIPLMFEDMRMIMIAQTSRGVNIYNGRFITKVKGLFNSILPMLVLAFKRSEDISNAMVIRGYEVGQKRVKFKKSKFSFLEIITLLAIIGLYILMFYIGGLY